MLVYLDMCCLKRPFDDQSQVRIRLESEAVLGLLSMERGDLQFVRSKALWFENSKNPVRVCALRVEAWLRSQPAAGLDKPLPQARIKELKALGFKTLDALHIATAEGLSADALVTCDDRLLAAGAPRHREQLRVRIVDVVGIAKELVK